MLQLFSPSLLKLRATSLETTHIFYLHVVNFVMSRILKASFVRSVLRCHHYSFAIWKSRNVFTPRIFCNPSMIWSCCDIRDFFQFKFCSFYNANFVTFESDTSHTYVLHDDKKLIIFSFSEKIISQLQNQLYMVPLDPFSHSSLLLLWFYLGLGLGLGLYP